MTIADRWLLPDGIEEILPPKARNLELVRRKLLDLYASWGYEYVIPPMIEFLESLLTGTGRDLDLKTFKMTDQLSGRLMGIRADMTPQVARIDAHSLNREGPARLCYAGTVLHAKADNMLASRSPARVGAELFDIAEPDGELEIISLMLESLDVVGVESVHLELGDVGIFRHLLAKANVTADREAVLFELIQRKAKADLQKEVADSGIDKKTGEFLTSLPDLMGTEKVLADALKIYSGIEPIESRITTLSRLSEKIKSRFAKVKLSYDLSELRGYSYHTGIVFAAYLGGSGQLLAKGGRYDRIGEVFGRARVATGFDVDLNLLAGTVTIEQDSKIVCLSKGEDEGEGKIEFIKSLRDQGYVVIEGKPGSNPADYTLIYQEGQWKLV